MSAPSRATFLFLTALALPGCASNDPRDPLEPTNRAIHAFNETVDRAALKPLAQGYQAITPTPVQTGVRNFYSNLDDVTVLANSLLQFKLQQASSDFLRLAFNTTFGFFGLLDVASEMGLKKHNEDFGQTLGYWGVSSGPYLVLPFLGPSSFRDGAGLVVDGYGTDVLHQAETFPSRTGVAALRIISRRADLIEAKHAIEAAALDPYEFNRDFYLERREALAQDGQPAPEE